LKDSPPFVEGAAEKPPAPVSKGTNVSFEAEADIPGGVVAFVGGRIITMRGDEVIEDGTLIVEKNRITAIGSREEITVPRGAYIVDTSEETVMPGLIDVHWHGSQGTNEIIPQRNWRNFATLAFGVTTLHDPSNDTSEIFAAGELARAGLITAPRIFSTGTILYGAKSPVKAVIKSLDDARFHLRRMKAVGAFTVKSYNQPRRDQRQMVMTAGRELGIMIILEGGSLFQHNMNMIVDGHTGIEHSIPIANIYKDVIQFWSPSGTGYTPTMGIGYGGLSGEYYWYQHTKVWENERLLGFVPRDVIDARSRRRLMVPEEEFNHVNVARTCKQLVDAGGHVQIGAHGQREGLASHWEMWMLAQGGMTPFQVLRAATLDGAYYVGLDGDIGSLEPGKLADLIVLEKNPLEDIRNSKHVKYVMVNGRLYDARTMDQIGNHAKKRGKFFWEAD
jgi:imidazolonepropionase-like amidohydrolase